MQEPFLDIGLHKIKLLKKRVYLSNESTSLYCTINFYGVVTLQNIAKMLHLLDPLKRVTIKTNWSHILQFFWLFGEDYAFGLGLGCIGVGSVNF